VAKRRQPSKEFRKVESSQGPLTHNPFTGLAVVGDPSPSERATEPAEPAVPPTASPSAMPTSDARHFPGQVTLQRETKGRGGKAVTRIGGLAPAHLDEMCLQMKRALGCGATVEPPDLLLLGSLEQRAAQWLREAGARLVVIGTASKATDRLRSQPNPSRSATTVDRHKTQGAAAARGGTTRSMIRRGQRVAIVLKADQSTGRLTEGAVKAILTRSANHPHGIKVLLESGLVGRVKRILD
jgi:uncharacterized repeat protein (TIGR03833 family)